MSDTGTNAAPAGYHTVTPYLLVDGVARLLTFLADAFDAQVAEKLDRPDGTIMHAEVKIGDSMVMMGEPMKEFGPIPASIYLYVADCDAIYARALAAGGESIMDVTTMEHAGQRYGGVRDPSGNLWWIASHLESLPPEEQQARIDAHPEKWD